MKGQAKNSHNSLKTCIILLLCSQICNKVQACPSFDSTDIICMFAKNHGKSGQSFFGLERGLTILRYKIDENEELMTKKLERNLNSHLREHRSAAH